MVIAIQSHIETWPTFFWKWFLAFQIYILLYISSLDVFELFLLFFAEFHSPGGETSCHASHTFSCCPTLTAIASGDDISMILVNVFIGKSHFLCALQSTLSFWGGGCTLCNCLNVTPSEEKTRKNKSQQRGQTQPTELFIMQKDIYCSQIDRTMTEHFTHERRLYEAPSSLHDENDMQAHYKTCLGGLKPNQSIIYNFLTWPIFPTNNPSFLVRLFDWPGISSSKVYKFALYSLSFPDTASVLNPLILQLYSHALQPLRSHMKWLLNFTFRFCFCSLNFNCQLSSPGQVLLN